MKIKIVCVQTTSSKFPVRNIQLLDKVLSGKNLIGANLVCLPECVAIFSDDKKKIQDYIDNWHEKFLNLIKGYARKNNSYFLIGSIPHKKNNLKLLNRSLLIDPGGLIISHYDKINLFDVTLSKTESYLESKNYDPGNKFSLNSLPWGKLGMTICYDLRFPYIYKKLAEKGADFFSIPAAFTYTTGKFHWKSLLTARAIENGCFVFAPAQCGKHDNGRVTYGHSMIIDPWGRILKSAKNSIGTVSSFINLDEIEASRRRIPAMTEY